ncbi:MAG: T9SS type A sorting domain-containing protein, partial [bacterium]|nr:T9SS type A sorting domain-containing protein [bacterium]
FNRIYKKIQAFDPDNVPYYFKDKTYFFTSGMTFLNAAKILADFMDETIEYFFEGKVFNGKRYGAYWGDNTIGAIRSYYNYRSNSSGLSPSDISGYFVGGKDEDHYNPGLNGAGDYRGEPIPLNYNIKAGEVLLRLYLARQNYQEYSNINTKYLNRVKRITNLYKEITLHRTDNKLLYEWSLNNGETDEDEHIQYVSYFMDLCFKNRNILGEYAFDKNDMNYMAKAFMKNYYKGPRKISRYGTRPITTISNHWLAEYYLPFSHFDEGKDIYTIVSDVMYDKYNFALSNYAQYHRFKLKDAFRKNFTTQIGINYHGITTSDVCDDSEKELISLQSLKLNSVSNWTSSLLIYKYNDEGELVIVSGHNMENQEWVDVACGNIDQTGKDEIVALCKDGIYIYRYNSDHTISYITKLGSAMDWVSVAMGDYDNDGRDEIVALSNGDNGGYYIYKYTNAGFRKITDYIWGPGASWVGVATGNFDLYNDENVDDGDEFVTLQNNDKRVRIHKLDSDGNLVPRGSYLAVGVNSWSDIACGDINGDCKDEIIALSGEGPDYLTDGGGDIYVFEEKGDTYTLTEKEHYAYKEYISAITSSNITGNGKEEIIYGRNFDGDILVWEYTDPVKLTVDNHYPENTHLSNSPLEIKAKETLINSATYEVGSAVDLISGKTITLSKGFHAKNGSDVNAYIQTDIDTRNTDVFDEFYCNSAKKSYFEDENTDPIEYEEEIIEEEIKLIVNNEVLVYPVPNNGNFKIDFGADYEQYEFIEIRNILGQVCFNSKAKTNIINVSLNSKQPGLYTIFIKTKDKYITKKIIVE